MIEKVNPSHPDKVADRIAGAIVDLAYKVENNPKIAVEVLIGHGVCNVIVETSTDIFKEQIKRIVTRIAGDMVVFSEIHPQDKHLADNQSTGVRCGDNGMRSIREMSRYSTVMMEKPIRMKCRWLIFCLWIWRSFLRDCQKARQSHSDSGWQGMQHLPLLL